MAPRPYSGVQRLQPGAIAFISELISTFKGETSNDTQKNRGDIRAGLRGLLTAGATRSTAQSHVNSPDPLLGTPSVATETSNVNGITGHAEGGKMLYRRFCIGCHGPDGNGQGMNAQWIDPNRGTSPKLRSSAVPLLPAHCPRTRISITRSRAASSPPTCRPGGHSIPTAARRFGRVHQDLVATLGQGKARATLNIPDEKRRSPSKASCTAANSSRSWNAGSAMVRTGSARWPIGMPR